jgi:hypothetical protein
LHLIFLYKTLSLNTVRMDWLNLDARLEAEEFLRRVYHSYRH